MYQLWKSLGVKPDVVMGHSFGELPAMYASGAINLDTLIGLTYVRAKLMMEVDNRGCMAAVTTEHTHLVVEKVCDTDGLWIAANNSPTQFTTGKFKAMDTFIEWCNSKNITCKVKSLMHSHTIIR